MTAISATLHDTRELVRRTRGGDRSAFELLYRREVDRVYALCLRMTGDVRRAEELTQDTFVRAWKTIEQFREDSAFSTWLYRIAVNTVLMAERTKKRRRDRILPANDGRELDRGVSAHSRDAAIDLEDAVRRLPTQARTVLILHEIEGYRHDEIGEMLGIATGTSKAHLHRARTLLRQMLDR